MDKKVKGSVIITSPRQLIEQADKENPSKGRHTMLHKLHHIFLITAVFLAWLITL